MKHQTPETVETQETAFLTNLMVSEKVGQLLENIFTDGYNACILDMDTLKSEVIQLEERVVELNKICDCQEKTILSKDTRIAELEKRIEELKTPTQDVVEEKSTDLL